MALRLPSSTMDEIDRFAAELSKATGLDVSRNAAIRRLIALGLERR